MKKILYLIVAVLLTSCTSLSLPNDADLTYDDAWKIGSLVDEYGFKTGDHFIYSLDVSGSFSNTATIGSPLSGRVNIYQSSLGTIMELDLYEYDRLPATFIGELVHFYCSTSTERLGNGYAEADGTELVFYNQNAIIVVQALARGEDVRLLIDAGYSTKYDLTIEADGFGYALNQLLNMD